MSQIMDPIQSQERNKLVDVLRGFALLGVLIANLEGFVTFALTDEQARLLITSPADHITEAFISFFVENKFITLFSLLFGYGFGVVIDRVAKRGIPVNTFFMRRMIILLLIGLLHICFWWGEILSTYALCGMLLLLFRKVTNRSLLTWGAVLLFIITPLIQGLKIFLLPDASAFRDDLFKNYLTAIYSGKLSAIAAYNYKIVNFLFIERWSQYRDMAEILGKFLFGYYILRKNFLIENVQNIRLLKKVQLLSLAVACVYLAEKTIFFFSEVELKNKMADIALYTFERAGILSLSLFYATSVSLLYYKRKMSALFGAFQATGMMSLTNYLTHTIFYVLIYYGMGLGLMGKAHMQWALPIAIVIYSAQIIFCKLWIKKMRYGPVEWIWRQATYGKRLPLKR